MSSLTRKTVGGHAYYYVRECKRVDGRPKIVSQKYLGRLEDILAARERQAQSEGIPVPQEALIREFGAVAALYDLSCRLGLATVIDRHVPKRTRGPSVGTYLLLAAISRCIAPRSKAAIGEWFGHTILPRLLDLRPSQVSSQRFWDNMNRVSPEAIAAIEEELVARMVKEFDLDVRRLLFDATNFFTFIDTFNSRSTLAQRGKNKEGRASLRIVGLALLVTADGHVPLLHHTYPGNEPDAPLFRSLTERLFSRIKRLCEAVEEVTLVFDKGNNARDNLEAIAGSGYHFVGSLVPTQHPELLALPRESFHSLDEQGLPGVLAYRTTKPVAGELRTVLVTFNENLFVSQCRTLLREIAKRQRLFRDLVAALERRRSGELRGGQPPTVAALQKKMRGWLKARHMKDLFKFEAEPDEPVPRVRYAFDQAAWDNLQNTLLGKTILFTDNESWAEADIVKAYRAQFHVEAAFRDLKDGHHIAIRPQYHWTDHQVRVHVFTCVLALMLMSQLWRQVTRQGIKLSPQRLLDLLTDIREAVMLFPPQAGGKHPIARTSLSVMNEEQRRLFTVLDLARYSSV